MNKTQVVSPDVENAAMEYARRYYYRLYAIEKPDELQNKPLMYWFFAVIAAASTALAALRTGPVFYEVAHQALFIAYLEAILAVIVVDMAAAGFAYLLVDQQSKNGKTHSLTKIMLLTLIFCILIQVGANLYAVIAPIMHAGQATAQLVIAILVGLAAPAVAFVSAHGVGVMTIEYRHSIKQMKHDYDALIQQREIEFRAWWDNAKVKREWIAKAYNVAPMSEQVRISKVELPSIPAHSSIVSTPSNESSIEAGLKGRYTQGASERVIQLFSDNPAALNWSIDEIALAANVATGTASTARKKYRESLAQKGQ